MLLLILNDSRRRMKKNRVFSSIKCLFPFEWSRLVMFSTRTLLMQPFSGRTERRGQTGKRNQRKITSDTSILPPFSQYICIFFKFGYYLHRKQVNRNHHRIRDWCSSIQFQWNSCTRRRRGLRSISGMWSGKKLLCSSLIIRVSVVCSNGKFEI